MRRAHAGLISMWFIRQPAIMSPAQASNTMAPFWSTLQGLLDLGWSCQS